MTSKISLSSKNILILLLAIMLVVTIMNISYIFNVESNLEKSRLEENERQRPARIELLVISDPKCGDCFDVSTILNSIKKLNVNVTKESRLDFQAKEAKELLSKYDLEKIPSIIIKGETEKAAVQGFAKKDDALVLAKTEAPYTNSTTGEIKGRVMLTFLGADCDECNDLRNLINQMKLAGIKIMSEKNVSYESPEGMKLAEKYKFEFIPTIILSREAEMYEVVQKVWPQVGSKEKDGSFVYRMQSPPYINTTTGQLIGLVDLTVLNDNGCEECYSPDLLTKTLQNQKSFAIRFDKIENLDISDPRGKEFISRYNITKVPAVILSEDIDYYPSKAGLKQLFSIEKDGSYVFRKPDIMGAYKDLTKNVIIKPTKK